ncbi:ectoine hydroxylase [Alkalicoccobacillus porphyridii]|uniref:Ectoine hydroxylase n=1 Tax=Alkalicoccobacillus porphyridii TaxID=2597270 RepID=A0A553ZVE6_9BACI|nr:ectoine hydroxylase [Alkalicoccobacillus porphyridii]TSB45286.1 ectoine hydroxylase [Alkalicoccobacillus porphyridii]
MNIDLYPSRVSNKATIKERKDPIIHSNGEGPLNKEELTSYEDNGYLMKEKLFTDEEVKLMTKELEKTMKDNQSKDTADVIKEPGSNEIRSVFEIHKDSGFFELLSKNERIVKIAEQLLGSQVYINQSRINFKPGFKGKEFYWHSDFETWHVEDGMQHMRAVSCSIILTDNYEFNGPLMLIPGSHKWYVSCAGSTPDDNFKSSLQKQEAGTPDNESLSWLTEQADGRIDRATGPAGSVLFFECNTMHGSNGNLSPYPRSNVFFVFNSIKNPLGKPYSGQEPRPEFVANRERIEPIEAVPSDFLQKQKTY